MLSARDIQDVIEDGFQTVYDEEDLSGWDDLENVLDGRYDHETKTWVYGPVGIKGIGEVSPIETKGGEGQGDHMHLVFRVVEGDGTDRLFRINGYYSSYGESYYEGDLYQVSEKQKLVTVYE